MEITKVDAKIKDPNKAPTDIKGPSDFPEAELEVRISGAPLAKAINVTAARVGDKLNLSDKSYIPTARYLSATEAT